MSTSSNFMLQFNDSRTISLMDFLKIWKHYDIDKSGYLETTNSFGDKSEFEKFLGDLLEIMLNEKPEDEEVKRISKSFIKTYDVNKDNRLQISELIEALPVERNFLQQFLGSEITHMDVDIIFDHYDKDESGQIQHEEVAMLVRDIYYKKVDSVKDKEELDKFIAKRQQDVISMVDKDGDGMIDKNEIRRVFKMLFKLK
ncbi:calbindin-32-like [Symsagittifera roscoffensis]|uniref:calbindin-32-like n=1 Tax=Symsagittifera roscoffensis TaxID=84072 RepID=UPI00307B8828